MSTIPQYAKTTDPEVIDAIQHNVEGQAEFHRRACEFAQQQGVEKGSYFPAKFGEDRAIRAIGGRTKPTTGQWKQGYGGHGWLPFKSNPLATELEAIRFDAKQVPGIPSMVYGAYNSNGQQHVAMPRSFIVDGIAYYGVGFTPIDEQPEAKFAGDGGWVEIKASEWHAAAETFNERIAA